MDPEEGEEHEEGEEVEGEKKSKKAPFPTSKFISEGIKYYRIGRLNQALESYSAALKQEPNCVKALIGRAQCLMRQGLVAQARADAETALGFNPRSIAAKGIVGEAEYHSGDFEQGFITYNRAHVTRPTKREMKLGQQVCLRAIENALNPEGEVLVLDKEEVLEGEGRGGRPTGMFKEDVECLEKLLSEWTFESVHPRCRELLEYVQGRRAFWKSQAPHLGKKTKKEAIQKDVKKDSVVEEQEVGDASPEEEDEAKEVSQEVMSESSELEPSASAEVTCFTNFLRCCFFRKKKSPAKSKDGERRE